MNDTRTLALMIGGAALLLIVFIAVIVYVCTYHVRIYRGLKKPVKTVGLGEAVEHFDDPETDHSYSHYRLITYSFEDNSGSTPPLNGSRTCLRREIRSRFITTAKTRKTALPTVN